MSWDSDALRTPATAYAQTLAASIFGQIRFQMAITDKARKTLWGRSGNRCSICQIELVHDKQENINLNVGEECHIVSSRPSGPRHRTLDNYDIFENLILLCRNHHTTIDQNVIKYTENEVLKIKATHEKWVKETLDNKINEDIPAFLTRVTTGKELVDIIKDVYGYKFDNDEVSTTEEAEKIGNFLEVLKDWGDNSELLDATDFAKISLDLKRDIDELEKMGFFVFGQRTREKVEHRAIWDIAVIRVIRKDNPIIIKIDLQNASRQQ